MMTHPRAILVAGKIRIDYLPLLCEQAGRYCSQADLNQEEMYKVTEEIFTNIIDLTKAHICVGYISGPDQGDPVVAFLHQRNIDVIDIRPSSAWYEADNLQPFDGHPGPIAHYHYFRKLLDYFQRLEPGDAGVERPNANPAALTSRAKAR
jgi:hypothetical protein